MRREHIPKDRSSGKLCGSANHRRCHRRSQSRSHSMGEASAEENGDEGADGNRLGMVTGFLAEALAERTNHHHQSMVLLKAKLQKLRQGLPPAKLQLRAMRPSVARRPVGSDAATVAAGKTTVTVCPV